MLNAKVVVAEQFRGPPRSGNGGYVCGLMARALGGACAAALRAPPPLNEPLDLSFADGAVRLTTEGGALVGEARPAGPESLSDPPCRPSAEEAQRAGLRFPGLERRFHPICFTCGDQLEEGFGLRVFAGQIEGHDPGMVAAVWRPHANFDAGDGSASVETVWAALDCPGAVAWAVQGGEAGLLGSMTCEVLRRPAVEEPTVIVAWPIHASGRKRVSGTALLDGEGRVIARSRQIWIMPSAWTATS